jgi:hypothetical protein
LLWRQPWNVTRYACGFASGVDAFALLTGQSMDLALGRSNKALQEHDAKVIRVVSKRKFA